MLQDLGTKTGGTGEDRQPPERSQRKRKGDRLEKYFNKAHSYFPTLILPPAAKAVPTARILHCNYLQLFSCHNKRSA